MTREVIDNMTREYASKIRDRQTTTYMYEEYAYRVVDRLEKLRRARFDWIRIPQFEYRIEGCTISLTSDFIKGWYCTEPLKLYDEIVLREDDYTFSDPHPSNFITCSRTQETFAVDMEVPDRKQLARDFVEVRSRRVTL